MRRGLWLAAAVAGLALVAWLLVGCPWEEQPRELPGDEGAVGSLPEEAALHADSPLPSAPPAPGGALPGEPPRATSGTRTPLLAALPGGSGTSALVVQVASLRHSPLAQRLLDCVLARGGHMPLELLRASTGVDPLEDLHQLGVSREGVVLGGRFPRARLEALLTAAGLHARAYGNDGHIYSPTEPRRWVLPDGSVREVAEAWGLWGEEILVLGPGSREVEQALDRLEGRLPWEPLELRPEPAHGEASAILYPSDVAAFLPPAQKELLAPLAAMTRHLELHLGASPDVSLRAHVRTWDAAQAGELAHTLTLALTLARDQAGAEGQEQWVELLDQAQLTASEGELHLDVTLPPSLVEESLATCR